MLAPRPQVPIGTFADGLVPIKKALSCSCTDCAILRCGARDVAPEAHEALCTLAAGFAIHRLAFSVPRARLAFLVQTRASQAAVLSHEALEAFGAFRSHRSVGTREQGAGSVPGAREFVVVQPRAAELASSPHEAFVALALRLRGKLVVGALPIATTDDPTCHRAGSATSRALVGVLALADGCVVLPCNTLAVAIAFLGVAFSARARLVAEDTQESGITFTLATCTTCTLARADLASLISRAV